MKLSEESNKMNMTKRGAVALLGLIYVDIDSYTTGSLCMGEYDN
jgi:hypothetical protein